MSQIIKSVIPYNCPSCSTPLHIAVGVEAPGLVWVVSEDQMKKNKERLKEILQAGAFSSKEAEENTMKYIDSDEFMVAESEIEEMARDIMNNQ